MQHHDQRRAQARATSPTTRASCACGPSTGARPTRRTPSAPASPVDAATSTDSPWAFTVQCVATADINIGSNCNLTTTVDAITAGHASRRASARSSSSGRIQVWDGGSDGQLRPQVNDLFAHPGPLRPLTGLPVLSCGLRPLRRRPAALSRTASGHASAARLTSRLPHPSSGAIAFATRSRRVGVLDRAAAGQQARGGCGAAGRRRPFAPARAGRRRPPRPAGPACPRRSAGTDPASSAQIASTRSANRP